MTYFRAQAVVNTHVSAILNMTTMILDPGRKCISARDRNAILQRPYFLLIIVDCQGLLDLPNYLSWLSNPF